MSPLTETDQVSRDASIHYGHSGASTQNGSERLLTAESDCREYRHGHCDISCTVHHVQIVDNFLVGECGQLRESEHFKVVMTRAKESI